MSRYTVQRVGVMSKKFGGRLTPVDNAYVVMAGPLEIDSFATEAEAVEEATALEAAAAFQDWLKAARTRNFPDNKTALRAWVADEGAPLVQRRYDLFSRVAELLVPEGFETLPAPSEGEFGPQVEAYDRHHVMAFGPPSRAQPPAP